MKEPPAWAIVANVVESSSALRVGARVVVIDPGYGGGCERMQVTGLSKGGRPITAWVTADRLRDFRPGYIDDGRKPGAHCPTKEYAQGRCDEIRAAMSKATRRPRTRVDVGREMIARVRADAIEGKDVVVVIHPDNLDAMIRAGFVSAKE